jgi:uncharacterized membrane protein
MPDLHPQLVHFPIALLSLYAVFEIVSIKAIQRKPYWFYIKATLVMFGTVFGGLAALSGLNAAHFAPTVPLMAAHMRFAVSTLIVFAFVSLLYGLTWFGGGKTQELAWKFISNRVNMILVAVAGLALITITGGLGGAIVYGTEFDPFMAPVFKFLNLM